MNSQRLRDLLGLVRSVEIVSRTVIEFRFKQLQKASVESITVAKSVKESLDTISSRSRAILQENKVENTVEFSLVRLNILAQQTRIIVQHLLNSQTNILPPLSAEHASKSFNQILNTLAISVPSVVKPTQTDDFTVVSPLVMETEDSKSELSNKTTELEMTEIPKQLPMTSSIEFPKLDMEEIIQQSSLSPQAKARRVPASKLGRAVTFGNLAVGLGVSTMVETAKRGIGIGDSTSAPKNPLLSEANVERIVATLCRVRGAALKLGQMISIQDESWVSPEVAQIFDRVRRSADFMPITQMQSVLTKELGNDWRSKFSEFDETPFAAASIGQVHRGRLVDGRSVAVKVQYPGVAESIDSDVSNLINIMKLWNIFPQGMYMDNAVEVAKRELAWECDYHREAECSDRFRQLLANDPNIVVPEVFHATSSGKILTTEFISGLHLDECVSLDQHIRDFIGENLLRLCLLELYVFKFMQTDPNWANFFYMPRKRKLVLLDFGASREYPRAFIDDYIRVIHGAAEKDVSRILEYSHKTRFLTGYENEEMKEAHVQAVLALGEPFATMGNFDFGNQKVTSKIQKLIPTMLKYRLSPPPDESYSLHRKLSGCFLLCSKLKSNFNCRKLFYDIYSEYTFED